MDTMAKIDSFVETLLQHARLAEKSGNDTEINIRNLGTAKARDFAIVIRHGVNAIVDLQHEYREALSGRSASKAAEG